MPRIYLSDLDTRNTKADLDSYLSSRHYSRSVSQTVSQAVLYYVVKRRAGT